MNRLTPYMPRSFDEWLDNWQAYVPAQQARNDAQLHQAASDFRQVNPDCPLDVLGLVRKFIRSA